MKVEAIEALRAEEFADVFRVRGHTDAGILGLSETFYGVGAVGGHVNDKLAARLLGKNPPHIEALLKECFVANFGCGQNNAGVARRHDRTRTHGHSRAVPPVPQT